MDPVDIIRQANKTAETASNAKCKAIVNISTEDKVTQAVVQFAKYW